MEEKKRRYSLGRLVLVIFICIVLLAYGAFSMVLLYRIVPEQITQNAFGSIATGFLCFIGAFFPIGLFMGITDDKGCKKVYLFTVLISLFSIPYFIYGAYVLKLRILEENDYRIANQEKVKYTVTANYTVHGNEDSSKWELYFADSDNRKIDPAEIREIDLYDIVSMVANIRCSAHSIVDENEYWRSVNGTTIQKDIYLFFGDNGGKTRSYTDTVYLCDAEGNEIDEIDVEIVAERHFSVWDVLGADIIKNTELEVLDAIGQRCENISDAYRNTKDYVFVPYVFVVSTDQFCEVIFTKDVCNREATVGLMVDQSGHYYAGTVYYSFDSAEEADVCFDELLPIIKDKYGSSYEDEYAANEYWGRIKDGRVYYLEREDKEDKYTVSFYNYPYAESKNNDVDETDDILNDEEELASETWGELAEDNGGELPYDTLNEEQQDLVEYPELDVNKVYWTPGGKSYHSVDWCYTLSNSKEILSGTLDEAIEEGKTDPCSKCVGD